MPLAMMLGELTGALEVLPGVCASLGEGARRRTAAAVATPVGEVQVFSGSGAVSAAAGAWRAIEAAGGLATPFQSLALAQAATGVHLDQGEEPLIAVVRHDGCPVALFPGVVGRTGGIAVLRFLGDPLIQYGDILATPGASAQSIAAAFDAVADAQRASLLLLRKVRSDSRLASILSRRGHAVAEAAAPFVDVGSSENRNARDERELRRLRRRLAERGEVRFAVAEAAAARPLLRHALTLKRQWLSERDLASQVIGDRRWEAALVAAAEDTASLRIAAAALTVDGRSAAIEIGFVSGGTWFAFLGATDPDFAKAGPGQVLMADIIDHCRQQGLGVYDLLPPAQPYKQALATGDIAVADYALPLDLRGRLAAWGARLRPAAKRALASMPPPLRRLIARAIIDGRKP